jgi:hypothetical protein
MSPDGLASARTDQRFISRRLSQIGHSVEHSNVAFEPLLEFNPDAIRSLHATGVQKVVMLSGDNQRWRSAKRIASWLSLANALRADSSESLFAMSWTDENTGLVPAEAVQRWKGPFVRSNLRTSTPLGPSNSGFAALNRKTPFSTRWNGPLGVSVRQIQV